MGLRRPILKEEVHASSRGCKEAADVSDGESKYGDVKLARKERVEDDGNELSNGSCVEALGKEDHLSVRKELQAGFQGSREVGPRGDLVDGKYFHASMCRGDSGCELQIFGQGNRRIFQGVQAWEGCPGAETQDKLDDSILMGRKPTSAEGLLSGDCLELERRGDSEGPLGLQDSCIVVDVDNSGTPLQSRYSELIMLEPQMGEGMGCLGEAFDQVSRDGSSFGGQGDSNGDWIPGGQENEGQETSCVGELELRNMHKSLPSSDEDGTRLTGFGAIADDTEGLGPMEDDEQFVSEHLMRMGGEEASTLPVDGLPVHSGLVDGNNSSCVLDQEAGSPCSLSHEPDWWASSTDEGLLDWKKVDMGMCPLLDGVSVEGGEEESGHLEGHAAPITGACLQQPAGLTNGRTTHSMQMTQKCEEDLGDNWWKEAVQADTEISNSDADLQGEVSNVAEYEDYALLVESCGFSRGMDKEGGHVDSSFGELSPDNLTILNLGKYSHAVSSSSEGQQNSSRQVLDGFHVTEPLQDYRELGWGDGVVTVSTPRVSAGMNELANNYHGEKSIRGERELCIYGGDEFIDKPFRGLGSASGRDNFEHNNELEHWKSSGSILMKIRPFVKCGEQLSSDLPADTFIPVTPTVFPSPLLSWNLRQSEDKLDRQTSHRVSRSPVNCRSKSSKRRNGSGPSSRARKRIARRAISSEEDGGSHELVMEILEDEAEALGLAATPITPALVPSAGLGFWRSTGDDLADRILNVCRLEGGDAYGEGVKANSSNYNTQSSGGCGERVSGLEAGEMCATKMDEGYGLLAGTKQHWGRAGPAGIGPSFASASGTPSSVHNGARKVLGLSRVKEDKASEIKGGGRLGSLYRPKPPDPGEMLPTRRSQRLSVKRSSGRHARRSSHGRLLPVKKVYQGLNGTMELPCVTSNAVECVAVERVVEEHSPAERESSELHVSESSEFRISRIELLEAGPETSTKVMEVASQPERTVLGQTQALGTDVGSVKQQWLQSLLSVDKLRRPGVEVEVVQAERLKTLESDAIRMSVCEGSVLTKEEATTLSQSEKSALTIVQEPNSFPQTELLIHNGRDLRSLGGEFWSLDMEDGSARTRGLTWQRWEHNKEVEDFEAEEGIEGEMKYSPRDRMAIPYFAPGWGGRKPMKENRFSFAKVFHAPGSFQSADSSTQSVVKGAVDTGVVVTWVYPSTAVSDSGLEGEACNLGDIQEETCRFPLDSGTTIGGTSAPEIRHSGEDGRALEGGDTVEGGIVPEIATTAGICAPDSWNSAGGGTAPEVMDVVECRGVPKRTNLIGGSASEHGNGLEVRVSLADRNTIDDGIAPKQATIEREREFGSGNAMQDGIAVGNGNSVEVVAGLESRNIIESRNVPQSNNTVKDGGALKSGFLIEGGSILENENMICDGSASESANTIGGGAAPESGTTVEGGSPPERVNLLESDGAPESRYMVEGGHALESRNEVEGGDAPVSGNMRGDGNEARDMVIAIAEGGNAAESRSGDGSAFKALTIAEGGDAAESVNTVIVSVGLESWRTVQGGTALNWGNTVEGNKLNGVNCGNGMDEGGNEGIAPNWKLGGEDEHRGDLRQLVNSSEQAVELNTLSANRLVEYGEEAQSLNPSSGFERKLEDHPCLPDILGSETMSGLSRTTKKSEQELTSLQECDPGSLCSWTSNNNAAENLSPTALPGGEVEIPVMRVYGRRSHNRKVESNVAASVKPTGCMTSCDQGYAEQGLAEVKQLEKGETGEIEVEKAQAVQITMMSGSQSHVGGEPACLKRNLSKAADAILDDCPAMRARSGARERKRPQRFADNKVESKRRGSSKADRNELTEKNLRQVEGKRPESTMGPCRGDERAKQVKVADLPFESAEQGGAGLDISASLLSTSNARVPPEEEEDFVLCLPFLTVNGVEGTGSTCQRQGRKIGRATSSAQGGAGGSGESSKTTRKSQKADELKGNSEKIRTAEAGQAESQHSDELEGRPAKRECRGRRVGGMELRTRKGCATVGGK